MKALIVLFIIILISIAIWMIGTVLAVRGIEKPKYSVRQQKNGYEIREYAKYIVAEVEVNGTQEKATRKWFSLLAWYIFWWNNSGRNISMTAPVNDIKTSWEKIAMTAPVNDIKTWEETHTIQFILPSSSTINTLPIPDNDKVKLREKPAHKAAVLTYSGWASETVVEAKKQELRELLEKDGIKIIGNMNSAQYNPPLSFPFLRRNEIIAEIE